MLNFVHLLTLFRLRRSHVSRSPQGTYSMTRNIFSWIVQHPTMDTTFLCEPNSFICSISNVNSSFCVLDGSSKGIWIYDIVFLSCSDSIIKCYIFAKLYTSSDFYRTPRLLWGTKYRSIPPCNRMSRNIQASRIILFSLSLHSLSSPEKYLTPGEFGRWYGRDVTTWFPLPISDLPLFLNDEWKR